MDKTQELHRDLADRDWWRSICKALGRDAQLVGWTYRDNATIQWGHSTVELDGSVCAALINHRRCDKGGANA